ncbi:hypothetical protein DFS34DRAFT_76987 [Phlyctochytrium arcticum]|nr:hypothetical protein DFS34DRAFT_76987 [Phlyctochytrium arcticum]
MASLSFQDIDFPSELYDPVRGGFSEAICDYLLFAPQVYASHQSQSGDESSRGLSGNSRKYSKRGWSDTFSIGQGTQRILGTAFELFGEFVKGSARERSRREDRSDEQGREKRQRRDGKTGFHESRSASSHHDDGWTELPQEEATRDRGRHHSTGYGGTKARQWAREDENLDTRNSSTDESNGEEDSRHARTTPGMSRSANASDAPTRSSSGDVTTTTTLVAGTVLTVTTLTAAYRSSQHVTNQTFYDSFHTVHNEVQEALTRTRNWVKTRHALSLPVPECVTKDLRSLESLVDGIAKLDPGRHHQNMSRAYAVGSVSAAVAAASFFAAGVVPYAARYGGGLGIAAAAAYAAVLQARAQTPIVSQSLELVARRTRRVCEALESEEVRRAADIQQLINSAHMAPTPPKGQQHRSNFVKKDNAVKGEVKLETPAFRASASGSRKRSSRMVSEIEELGL